MYLSETSKSIVAYTCKWRHDKQTNKCLCGVYEREYNLINWVDHILFHFPWNRIGMFHAFHFVGHFSVQLQTKRRCYFFSLLTCYFTFIMAVPLMFHYIFSFIFCGGGIRCNIQEGRDEPDLLLSSTFQLSVATLLHQGL